MGDVVFELWEAVGAFVIIEKETGYFFSNQVGGTRCAHPVVEGILVPLDRYKGDEAALGELTRDWYSDRGLPEYDLYRLRTLVEEFTGISSGGDWSVRLDEERMKTEKWGEAWIPVITPYGPGWLTWENSD